MKIILGVLLIMLSASITQAQSIGKSFAQLNKLSVKAKGEKYEKHTVFTKETMKLGRQEFSQSSVICREISNGKHDKSTRISSYSSIPWDNVKDFNFLEAYNSDKLIRLRINFASSFKREEFAADESDDKYVSRTDDITIYILQNDRRTASEIMDKIVAYFKKK